MQVISPHHSFDPFVEDSVVTGGLLVHASEYKAGDHKAEVDP